MLFFPHRMLINFLVIMCIGSASTSVLAEPSPKDLSPQEAAEYYLDRLSHSLKEQNYSGDFTLTTSEGSQSFHLTHAVIEGVEYERLVSLDGKKVELIRHGHDANCIHAGEKLMRKKDTASQQGAAGNFPSTLIENPELLKDVYKLAIHQSADVADHDALKIVLMPRDGYRHLYVFWIEPNTGFLLKSQMVNRAGRVLEQMQFTQLELGSELSLASFELEPATALEHPVRKAMDASHDNLKQDPNNFLAQLPVKMRWLPTGFRLTQSKMTSTPHDVFKAMYTDGLSAFTVFVDTDQQNRLPSMGRTIGASVVVVRKLYKQDSKLTVTVVGEVPMMTARKVAASVMVP